MTNLPRLVTASLMVFSVALGMNLQLPRIVAAGQQTPPAGSAQAPATRTYVGSQACRQCHPATYERWSKTRMANVVTDPREHPEVVLPDFDTPNPLLTFTLSDVAFVYGT